MRQMQIDLKRPSAYRTRIAGGACAVIPALAALTLALAPASWALHAQTVPFKGQPQDTPAATQLPATPPTSAATGVNGATQAVPPTAPAAVVPARIAATPLPNRTRAQRAEVSYTGGLIDVRANNSSLRQILRAISRQTGMTIVGGIADDRVFGNYGPDTPSAVLATLVDGTGTNMLLREGDATHPMELVLTPQTGGASAGNDSIGSDAEDDAGTASAQSAQAATQGARSAPPVSSADGGNVGPSRGPQNQIPPQPSLPPSNVNGSPLNSSPTASEYPTTNSVPIDSLPAPSTTPSSTGIVDAPNPPSSGAGAPAATPPTPEQVYQQLLKMQQNQQSAPSSGTTSNPPQ